MCRKLLLLVLVLGLVSPALAAYVTPTVENYSFELPGDGKHNMWDEGTNTKGTFTDVPDWESDTAAYDSGIEGPCAWPGVTEGEYAGFVMNGDPMAWNIVSYVIQSGDQFALAVDARDNWSANPPGQLQIGLYYVADSGSKTLLAPPIVVPLDGTQGTQAVDLCDPANTTWRTYILNVAAPDAGGVDHLLLIGLDNVTDDPDGYATSWIGVDNVRFVPEPATVALLGLGVLPLLRKRRT